MATPTASSWGKRLTHLRSPSSKIIRSYNTSHQTQWTQGKRAEMCSIHSDFLKEMEKKSNTMHRIDSIKRKVFSLNGNRQRCVILLASDDEPVWLDKHINSRCERIRWHWWVHSAPFFCSSRRSRNQATATKLIAVQPRLHQVSNKLGLGFRITLSWIKWQLFQMPKKTHSVLHFSMNSLSTSILGLCCCFLKWVALTLN